jgi:hypothetical protein
MSTDYVLSEKVTARDLFGGKLENRGIREHLSPDTDEERRCLTDGRNYLWVYISEDGLVFSLSRYFPNGAPDKILRAIAETFDTQIFSEYEPQYWGFATQEEWEAADKAMADRDRNEFYANLCTYIRGEPNEIRPGTIGEIKAKIAKTLVEEDVAFLGPENKDKLLDEMDAIYCRDHAVVVTLRPEDMGVSQNAREP